MTRFIVSAILLLITFTSISNAQQNPEVADKIVAVVNDHIILKSDVDGRLFEYLSTARGIRFSEELWFDVLESLIDNFVLVEKARIDSVIVSDDEVNRQLDQRIRMLVERTGSEENLERALGKSLVQIRVEFREQFRQEMLADRMRQQKRQSIRISRPEVEAFFNEIPTDSLPMIPETVELAQIVIYPPQKPEAQNRAFQKAAAIRDSILSHGADFETMARRHGEDGTAARGGLLPLMPMSDLVSEYSAAASALQPGEISQVVRTVFGYHIIRLNRRVADQIETNHILIRVGEDELDDQVAIDRLTAIRDSVLHHNRTFANMARRHSEDKTTAPAGGRMMNMQSGERRLAVPELESSLFRQVITLREIGEISEPRPFNTGLSGAQSKAYRIVKLINRIPEHRANLEQDYELMRNFALQQKQMEVMQQWMNKIRKEVYIEYKIHHPYLSHAN